MVTELGQPWRASGRSGARPRPFDDPAEAVRGATRVHLTLSDDAAVDDVLEKARAGFATDMVIIDHITTSPCVVDEVLHQPLLDRIGQPPRVEIVSQPSGPLVGAICHAYSFAVRLRSHGYL